ncbi:MAG TPA: hypothetical protein VLE96_04820 [Chlamydiales bacterium]|nr:hypothetical protein [Chlamydiales bacterium]
MTFLSKRQSFVSLTCILGGSAGIPMMLIGGQLATLYGNGVALTSILIGNFILWLIGLSILSMAKHENTALENIRYYMGKRPSFVIAVIWIFSFLLWYVIQLKVTIQAMSSFLPNQMQYLWIIGVGLGLMTAWLSMREIGIIKKLSTYLFPCLIVFAICSIITSQHKIEFAGSWGISFVGILSVVFIWLPFTLNLPTIFRYSSSKANSLIALTLISISHVFFQIFALITGIDNPIKMVFLSFSVLTFLFIFCNCILVNILNIYFAKSALDLISNTFGDGIKYLIIGITGTVFYIFFSEHFLMKFLEETILNFIVVLGAVLMFDFFIRAITRHRMRTLEKFWSSFCYFAGCIASIIIKYKGNEGPEKTAFIGVIACSLILLMIIFAEETAWSIQNIRTRHKIE